jgi:hypothetical protein
MNERFCNLELYHSLFLCSFHSFVLKHILHVIILKIVYDLMSNVNIYMTRVPHRSPYFDLLNGNLKNWMNKVFLSFDTIVFNMLHVFQLRIDLLIILNYFEPLQKKNYNYAKIQFG